MFDKIKGILGAPKATEEDPYDAFVDDLSEVVKVSLSLAQIEFAQATGNSLPKPTAEKLQAFLQTMCAAMVRIDWKMELLVFYCIVNSFVSLL
jgi:hypothetical protein